jgi:hypothetical protein
MLIADRIILYVSTLALMAGYPYGILTVAQTQLSPNSSQLGKGLVANGVYANPSIGLELRAHPDLLFGAPELKAPPGKPPLSVSVAALSQKTWSSGREAMFFYADTLTSYPENERSTASYVRRIVRSNLSEGFEIIKAARAAKMGGFEFARTDFFKAGPAYETALIKACDKYAIVFVFTGSGRDVVDRLIAGTELKLDSTVSGCSIT